jgi:hypothetical protein
MSRPANPNNYGTYFQPDTGNGGASSGAGTTISGSGGLSSGFGYETPYAKPGMYRQETQTPNTVQIVGECAPVIYKVLAFLKGKDAGGAQVNSPVAVPITEIFSATGSDYRTLITAIQSLTYARLLALQDAETGPVVMLTAEGSRLVMSFG